MRRRRRKYIPRKREIRPRINYKIRELEVNVVDEEKTPLGIMKTRDALDLAKERGLDLVEINRSQKPPLVKIMDFGRHMYEKKKKEKGSKKTNIAQEIKTVRIGLYTDEHDLVTKAKKTDSFLKKGHPVKVEMFLKGRQRAMKKEARERTEIFPNYLTEKFAQDGPVKSSPRGFMILLRPKKK